MTIQEEIADHLLHIRRALDMKRGDLRAMLKPVNSQSRYENVSSRLDSIDARIEWIERHVDPELPF
jgi:hypothetical protein